MAHFKTWILSVILFLSSGASSKKLLGECDLDAGICDWHIRPPRSDNATWIQTSGSAPGRQTLPKWDPRNQDGVYFLRVSSGGNGGVASMTLEASGTSGRYCLQFYYWMYGYINNGPSLSVWVLDATGPHKVWSDNTNIGKTWSFVETEWFSNSTKFNVTIDGKQSKDEGADVAIDHIRLIEGACPGPVEGSRRVSLGEDVFADLNHITYVLSLNLTSTATGCRHICSRRNHGFSSYSHAKSLLDSQKNYVSNCFNRIKKCEEDADVGGCQGLGRDLTTEYINQNCTLSCGYCRKDDFVGGSCADTLASEERCIEFAYKRLCTTFRTKIHICARTCNSCQFAGPSVRIFSTSFWTNDDDTTAGLKETPWLNLDPSLTRYCVAYNTSRGFVKLPCNAMLPCLCENYQAPVYADIIAKNQAETATGQEFFNASVECDVIDARQGVKVVNLDMKGQYHVTSVMVETEKEKPTPPGYYEPLAEISRSPLAEDPYFNLAVGRPSYVSSIVGDEWGGPASTANDGRRNTTQDANLTVCTWTATGVTKGIHWWYVDLQATYLVHAVTVVRSDNDNAARDFIDYKIVVDNSTLEGVDTAVYFKQAPGLCYYGTKQLSKYDNPVMVLPCERRLIGRYVIIMKSQMSRSISLVLCEMEVHGQPLDLPSDALPALQYCQDETARLLNGYCYKYIGRLQIQRDQDVECRNWEPPHSEMVPVGDLSDLERDALRHWMFVAYGADWAWTKSYGPKCILFQILTKSSKIILTDDCSYVYGGVCRSPSRDVYPTPMIGIPKQTAGELQSEAKRMIFPETIVNEDSFVLQWEIYLSNSLSKNAGVHIFLLVLTKENGTELETRRLKLDPLVNIGGPNFGGFAVNVNEFVPMKKDSYIGLEVSGANLTDILDIQENITDASTATTVIIDGVPLKANVPLRVWILPQSVGHVKRRCYSAKDLVPAYKKKDNWGEYVHVPMREVRYGERKISCAERCESDDMCAWTNPRGHQKCGLCADERVVFRIHDPSMRMFIYRKTCQPTLRQAPYPIPGNLTSAVSVHVGNKACRPVTSYLEGQSAALFYCDTTGNGIKISVQSSKVKVCKIRAFGERVTREASTTPILKHSTRIRGNLWRFGNGTCAPLGYSREQVQWLQVDLLLTYHGVTAKAFFRAIKPRTPKFHMYVTSKGRWTGLDPYYVGYSDTTDQQIKFPCKECHSGRFVTLVEVGDAHGVDICRFDLYGDRGNEVRLGMAGGLILDAQVSANHAINGWEAHKARLDYPGAWCATWHYFQRPYIQVALMDVSVITAIETQGFGGEGVNMFTVKYGMDENHLVWYRDVLHKRQIFHSEQLGVSSAVHPLVTPIQCKLVRIQVESFKKRACMRLELLGYPKNVLVNKNYTVKEPSTIRSPGFPNYYGNDRTITWKITPPSGKYTRMKNITFSVQKNVISKLKMDEWQLPSPQLCQDRYTIHDKDGKPIVSNFGYYIHDTSDALELRLHACLLTMYHQEGYLEAEVDFVDCPGYGFNETSCDRQFGPITTECGYFNSPLFPQPYPDTKTCSWQIKTTTARYIKMEFIHFDVAGDGVSCTGDKLSLSYIDNGKKTALGALCNGNFRNLAVESDWNTLVLEYNRVRTKEEAGRGFVARFRTINPLTDQSINYTEGHCEDGWLRFKLGCYFFVNRTSSLTWREAESACQSLANGSHLASIQDEFQRDFIIYSLLHTWPYDSRSPRVYIGLTDQIHDGRYHWTDESPVTYTNWNSGQPDGSALEGCGTLLFQSLRSGRYWDDIACARRMTHQYICKMKAFNVRIYPITDIDHVIRKWNETCDVRRQFQCGNGECIQNLYVCDGTRDCKDGRDEVTCITQDGCHGGHFLCGDGACIPISDYCNHVTECRQGDDEEKCIWAPCHPGEFRCDNGQCIRNTSSSVRNFIKDCLDGSDERLPGCPGFQCYSGDCIQGRLRCDGTKDCMGTYNEDEAGCKYIPKLGDGFLNCSSGFPYNATQRCIYDVDVFNYSTGCRDLSHLQECDDFQCNPGFIKCPGQYCIPVRMLCNGINDCPNSEDEMNCETYTCPGMYKCHGVSNCLPQAQVCDGIRDCPHDDDEFGCSPCPDACQCTGYSYNCSKKDLDTWPIISDDARLIDLSRNALQELTSTLDFPVLGKLYLAWNNISSIQPDVFAKLQNLFFLDLRWNDLAVISSNTFRGLVRLNVLMLTGNARLATLEPNAFVVSEKSFGVKQLNFSNMAIKNIGNASLVGLEETLELDLSNNGLYSIATTAFSTLKKLQYLNISGNDINIFDGREAFKAMPGLQYLKSDDFRFCCQAAQVAEENCFPQKDPFSSCTDLIRLDVLRIFLWILGVVALLGNILVLLLRLLSREPMTANSSIVTSLALADLLMGVYLLIIATADTAFRGYYIEVDESWRTGPGCSIAGFLSVLSSQVSVFTLAIMSVDRFLVVVFPFSKHKINLHKARILIVLSWLIGAVLAGVPLIPSQYFGGKFYSRSGVCLSLHLTSETTPGWEYSVSVFLGLNLVAFLVIAVTYTWMYIVIKESADQMRSNTSRKKGENKELVIARKMALIILTDFACWMPIIILGLAAMSGKVVIPGDVYAWIAVFVLPINSAANPILYTLSSVQLIKQLLKRKSGPKASESIYKTSMSMVDDDGDEEASVKQVNCYREGSQLLPYLPDGGKIKPLGEAIKDGAHTLSLHDLIAVLHYVAQAMESLHSQGFVALSVTVDEVGVVIDDKCIVSRKSSIYSAYLCSGVKQATTDRELKDNIEDLGNTCKRLLRYHAMVKKNA